MKKTLIKLLTAILVCGAIVAVVPNKEVQAYTGTWDMNYEEACTYWSATPLWKQIYDLESAKSGYLDNAKADLKTYFKVSLNDYIWTPDAVRASRPLTANFLRDALSLTNPNIVNVVRGSVCSYQDLTDVLRAEVRSLAPSFCDSEVYGCADELRGYLACAGVNTVPQYNDWKSITHCTAFEFYMGCCYRGHRHCNSPHHGYKYYWGPWGWGWYAAEYYGERAERVYGAAYQYVNTAAEIYKTAETIQSQQNAQLEAMQKQAENIQAQQQEQIQKMQQEFEKLGR